MDIVCEDCYEEYKPVLEKQRLESSPLQDTLECAMCGTSPSRLNVDLGMGICDSCWYHSKNIENSAGEHVKLRTVIPDAIEEGFLYIGPKEAAADLAVLKDLRIKRVLICCSHLPAYLSDTDISYHRIPIPDSLDSNLCSYLPHAFDFISLGSVEANSTLVHCNAGVSRSGAVVVAWLMRAKQISFDEALNMAKAKRPIITPNTNFVTQLKHCEFLHPETS